MKITRIINKFFTYLYFIAKFKKHAVAFFFSHYNVSLEKSKLVTCEGKFLTFKNNNKNRFPVSRIEPYKMGLTKLINVLNNPAVQIAEFTENGFVLEVKGIRLNIDTFNNLGIFHEIYIEKLYNIHLPQNNCLFIDIGMNTGFATLLFANQPETKCVYSFEPFKQTFDHAVANINLNKNISNKIKTYNTGVSNESATLQVPQLEGGEASASTNKEFIEQLNLKSSGVVSVQVKGIIEILDEIIKENPDTAIVMKVDCEGEEYNIFKKLDASGYVKKVSAFYLEWHFKGPEILNEILTRNNFAVAEFAGPEFSNSGMLYAFRNQ